jgi:predicted ATPase/DNA-binding SARP family transcriptional activator
VEVSLLGPLQVEADGRPVVIGAAKERAALELLALHPGRTVRTDEVIEALWGTGPPRSARKTVQTYVAALRRVLPAGVIETEPAGYRLAIEPDQVDVARFEQSVRLAGAALSVGDTEAAVGYLEDGIALWRGSPVEDLAAHPPGMAEAARLDELLRGAEEDLYEAQLALGRHHRLAADLEAAVSREPLRERRWGQLMLTLYRCDRQADALRAYQQLRATLGDSLGIEPSPSLAALERSILLQAPELAGPPGPAGTAGGSARYGPAVASAPTGNLPGSLSSFVGRDDEVARVAHLLEGFRLVTLTGPGGVGKTRLAAEVARALAGRWADGVRLIELAGVDSAGVDSTGVDSTEEERVAVARAAALVLGVRTRTQRPDEARLAAALQDSSMLIILDNCEHLLEACAQLARAVAQGCAGVHVLTTSREPLGIPGERVFTVPTLSVPAAGAPDSVEELARFGAVQLFADRAQAQDESFRLDRANAPVIASICRRLDGIPLAVELASARLRSLPLREIERRLDRRFDLLKAPRSGLIPRHRTLLATVEWSYNLLGETEKAVLGRLSVFRSGWDLDAAAAVCAGEEVDPDQVADAIASLADKSLVQAERTSVGIRYGLLETVRLFAEQQLEKDAGDESRQVRAAHAATYLDLARRAAPHLAGPGLAQWLARLDLEHDNLRAALAYFSTSPADADRGLQLCVALTGYWYIRADIPEALEALDAALRHATDPRHDAGRAAACSAAGLFLAAGGDWPPALQRYQESLELATKVGDDVVLAQALRGLSKVVQQSAGDDERACELAGEAVQAARRAGSVEEVGRALERQAGALYIRGWRAAQRRGGAMLRPADWERVDRGFREALDHFQISGDQQMIAQALTNFASVELSEHRLDSAKRHLDAAFPLAADLRDDGLIPFIISDFGDHARQRGDYAAARRYFTDALRRFRRNNDRSQLASRLADLALCASGCGEPETAALLHGAAAAQWATIGEVLYSDADHEADRRSLLEVLGESGYAIAFGSGQRMPLEEAIALALDHGQPSDHDPQA